MYKENIKISMVRSPCYRYTFQPTKLKELVASKIEGNKILNLFAGKTILHPLEVRVDCDTTMPNIHYKMKVEDFLKINKETWNTIIYDPPWNARKAREKYYGQYIGRHIKPSDKIEKVRYIGVFTKLKNNIVEILKLNGIIISAGYEIDNFGKGRGMELERVIVVNPSGDIKPFFITVERKINNVFF